MRVETQIFDEVNQCYKIVFVNKEEPKTKKPKRFRGKNKVSNFKDKQRVKQEEKKAITGWQFSTQITHRARFGANPYLKVVNNWS